MSLHPYKNKRFLHTFDSYIFAQYNTKPAWQQTSGIARTHKQTQPTPQVLSWFKLMGVRADVRWLEVKRLQWEITSSAWKRVKCTENVWNTLIIIGSLLSLIPLNRFSKQFSCKTQLFLKKKNLICQNSTILFILNMQFWEELWLLQITDKDFYFGDS